MPHEPDYPNYPDEFGGAYYQDQYLYICLTGDSPENRQKYSSLVSNPGILRFLQVTNSYNSLYELSMMAAKLQISGLSSIGVDVYSNTVDISFADGQTAAPDDLSKAKDEIVEALTTNYALDPEWAYGAIHIKVEQQASPAAAPAIPRIQGGSSI